MSGERILIVEDDAAIVAGLSSKLEREGYRVSAATDGRVALSRFRDTRPDLVILDLMLPHVDGFEVLRRIRKESTTLPVLILSARGREDEKVSGLRAGADDYLAKPFGLKELLARVDALLRRTRGGRDTVNFGPVTVDLKRQEVVRAGRPVRLSRKELELLLVLARRHDQVLSREMIQGSVWGDSALSDARAVDYHILNLRRKLEDDPHAPRHIVTRHGLGYELVTRSS